MFASGYAFCRLLWLLTAFLQWWPTVSGHVNHTHAAEMLKQKWTVENVIRDTEHLKEDLASMIELANEGQFTDNEMAFYLVRMHDFDDNGGLDGIELRVAAAHSIEHQRIEDYVDVEKKMEEMIDEVLNYDLNSDGLVDYGELKMRNEEKYRTE